jgi:hypothetical protein
LVDDLPDHIIVLHRETAGTVEHGDEDGEIV